MRVAWAHCEGTNVQRAKSAVDSSPGLSAVEAFPDSPRPSDIEGLRLSWVEEDTAHERIGERLPDSLPLHTMRRGSKEAFCGSRIDDIRIDHVEDNRIDSQRHPSHQFLFGNQSIVDFLPPHPGAVGPIDPPRGSRIKDPRIAWMYGDGNH